MQVTSGVVAVAAVGALALGGLALAVSKSSAGAAAAPTAVNFTQGHRYQVTLSMGSPQLPDFTAVSQSIAAASGGGFTLVSLTSTATAVTYVVDATKTISVPVSGLQAGYNGAATGGISVHVDDLGPTPQAVGGTLTPPALPPPATPPTGTTAPPATSSPPTTAPAPTTPPTAATAATGTTLVTDPAMVTFAQGTLNTEITIGGLLGPPILPVNGNANDPAFVANLQQYQRKANLPITGVLDLLTWADLLMSVLFKADPSQRPPNPTTTDPTITAAAQNALARCVGRGVFSRLSYGTGDVNGQATDPRWVASLTEAQRQVIALGFTVVTSGSLDYASLAFLVGAAWGALSGANATAVEPATPVTDANDLGLAAASLILLQRNGVVPSGGPGIAAASGDPTDPGTVNATRAVQQSNPQLAERTGATGVLDYLTFAVILTKALPFFFPGVTGPLNNAPAEQGTLFQVTSAADIAGAQLAMALMVQPGFAGSVPAMVKQRWSAADVGAAATDPNWMTVVAAWAAAQSTGQVFTLRIDGALDWPIWATILVSAYLG